MSPHFLIKQNSDEAVITLNRPERGNAYNGDMAEALAVILEKLSHSSLKRLVLKGNGKNFCTGADLEWMAQGPALSLEENENEMRKILRMYKALLSLPFPVIAHVQGKVRGGGLGLVSVADTVIADPATDFHLPERKLGLVPGIIEPLVVARIGEAGLKALEDHEVKVPEAKTLALIHTSLKKIPLTPELLSAMEEKLLESAKRRHHFSHVR